MRLESGAAIACPWGELGADEFLALASDDLGRNDLGDWGSGEDAAVGAEKATAIAVDERSLLFAGFKVLGAGLSY